jgi:hypothetical protein
MIVAVDLEQLAELAFAGAGRHPARSPERRAAGHLWIALTIPDGTLAVGQDDDEDQDDEGHHGRQARGAGSARRHPHLRYQARAVTPA